MQLALGQIAKQLSGLKPLSLSNNENYRLKRSAVYLCNERKINDRPTIQYNSVV